MKLPWRKQESENEVYLGEKPKKKKETLVSVAEKILIRKMKQDSEYGIEIAEKVKRMSRPEPKTVSDFLKELKEYRSVMKEAGLEGGGDKGMLRQILEVLPSIPALLQEARQLQQSMPQGMPPPQPAQIYQPPVQQIAEVQPQIEQQKKKSPKFTLKLEEVMDLLMLTPQQAWQTLHDRGEEGWIKYLSTNSFEDLVKALENIADRPEYSQYMNNIKDFLKQQHAWLQGLVEIAHGVVKTDQ